jgi:hypothetical protein
MGANRWSSRAGSYATRLAAALLGALAVVLVASFPATAQPASVEATAAKASCQYYSRGGPCAPIMSVYTYSGYREGDLKLISAKLGPEQKVGKTYVSTPPVPGMYEVVKRTFTWHAASGIEIVGVYLVHEVGRGFTYKKLPTGKHSGQVKLTDVIGSSEPILLLQGRRVQAAPSHYRQKASTATTKGSSCAHPYRVFWLVPGVDIPPIDRGNKTPGEMAGDTRLIKASAAYLGPLPRNPTPTVGRFGASWKPEVRGLKVCTARLTFTWRKPLVSHQWHPHSVIVLFNPELESNHKALDRITSVVVTAAR